MGKKGKQRSGRRWVGPLVAGLAGAAVGGIAGLAAVEKGKSPKTVGWAVAGLGAAGVAFTKGAELRAFSAGLAAAGAGNLAVIYWRGSGQQQQQLPAGQQQQQRQLGRNQAENVLNEGREFEDLDRGNFGGARQEAPMH